MKREQTDIGHLDSHYPGISTSTYYCVGKVDQPRITHESGANENQELETIEAQHKQHLKESESRYTALKYDMFVLSRKRESVIGSSSHER